MMVAPVGFWENNVATRRELAKDNMNAGLLQYNDEASLDLLLSKLGMMGYATDIKTFMRHNGTNFVKMGVISFETPAPAASASQDGRLVYDTAASTFYGYEGGRRYVLGASVALSSTVAESITAGGISSAGVDASASRRDHGHGFSVGAPIGLRVGQTGSVGSSLQGVRRDHRHSVPRGMPVRIGSANAEGNSGRFADAEHVHQSRYTIHQSDRDPTPADWEHGDIWLKKS